MPLVILKFGGSSLKTSEGRKSAIEHIMRSKKRGIDVVVVVSAIGRIKDPYATDTLIKLLKFDGSTSICAKKKDLIMSCGEIISATVMATKLENNGFSAEAMTGFQAGILTNPNFGEADIIDINTKPILEVLKEGGIPVVAGFQGITENGDITTLGRGGSDITAIALGSYLKADLVKIFTDVPGITCIDPKIIPEAPLIPKISFDEVLAMAENGAQVIHPRAVKLARNFGIPFEIRSNFEKSEGTFVSNETNDLRCSGISVQKNLSIAIYHKDAGMCKNKLKNNFLLKGKDIFYVKDGKLKPALLISKKEKTKALEIAQDFDAYIKFNDGLSKISLIYKKIGKKGSKEMQNSILSLLKTSRIDALTWSLCKDCFKIVVPDRDYFKVCRILFDSFFAKSAKQVV